MDWLDLATKSLPFLDKLWQHLTPRRAVEALNHLIKKRAYLVRQVHELLSDSAFLAERREPAAESGPFMGFVHRVLAGIPRVLDTRDFEGVHTILFVRDATTRELRPLASLDISLRATCSLRLREESVAGEAYATGQEQYCADVTKDPRYEPVPRSRPYAAVYCVPIVCAGAVVGVLSVTHPQANGFSRDDLFHIKLLARCVALGILGWWRGAMTPEERTAIQATLGELAAGGESLRAPREVESGEHGKEG